MFEAQRDAKHLLATAVASRLAAAVVTRVAGLLPKDVLILVDNTQIALAKERQILAKIDFGPLLDQDGDILELAEMALRSALSAIQDFVVEELTTPWPTMDAENSARRFFLPDASGDSKEIRLWFGDATNPVLTLQAITLGEIGLGGS